MRTKSASERAGEAVARWRREQLVETGVPLPLTDRVAEDHRYDLHPLIELVERGCRPDVAIRILAPLDEEAA